DRGLRLRRPPEAAVASGKSVGQGAAYARLRGARGVSVAGLSPLVAMAHPGRLIGLWRADRTRAGDAAGPPRRAISRLGGGYGRGVGGPRAHGFAGHDRPAAKLRGITLPGGRYHRHAERAASAPLP